MPLRVSIAAVQKLLCLKRASQNGVNSCPPLSFGRRNGMDPRVKPEDDDGAVASPHERRSIIVRRIQLLRPQPFLTLMRPGQKIPVEGVAAKILERPVRLGAVEVGLLHQMYDHLARLRDLLPEFGDGLVGHFYLSRLNCLEFKLALSDHPATACFFSTLRLFRANPAL
ncbi:hypothetical protein MPLB_20007 [Mesorhizobium sp. ORS 3324]|nr:hypothetical protein MPLB_20007 [Mesorhizobium sp. ORS 3324]